MDPDGLPNPPVQNQSDPLPPSGVDPAANVSIPPNDPVSVVPGTVPPPVQDPPPLPTAPLESAALQDAPIVVGNPVSPLGSEPSNPAMPESFAQTMSVPTPPLATPPAFDQPMSPAAAPQDPPTIATQPAADPAPGLTVQASSGKVKLLAIIAFLLAIATAVLFFVTRMIG